MVRLPDIRVNAEFKGHRVALLYDNKAIADNAIANKRRAKQTQNRGHGVFSGGLRGLAAVQSALVTKRYMTKREKQVRKKKRSR